MNVIDALAKSAGLYAGSNPEDTYQDVDPVLLQKFASMIIFECIKLAVFRGDKETAEAIKEHFEIKV